MRTHRNKGGLLGMARVMWLLPLLGLLPPLWGQELPPESADPAASLQEAHRLNDQILPKLYSEGRYETAIPLAQRALAIRERLMDPNHPDVAASLSNLAVLYKAWGAYERAELLFQRALAIREQVLGPNSPEVATVLNRLGELYQAQGAYTYCMSWRNLRGGIHLRVR